MVVLCCIVVVTGFLPFPVSRSSLSSPPSQVDMQYYIKCARFAFGSWTVFKVTRVSVVSLDIHIFLPKSGFQRHEFPWVSCERLQPFMLFCEWEKICCVTLVSFPCKTWNIRSFLTLLDHHLATGFPEGDVSTRVSDAWSNPGGGRFFFGQ